MSCQDDAHRAFRPPACLHGHVMHSTALRTMACRCHNARHFGWRTAAGAARGCAAAWHPGAPHPGACEGAQMARGGGRRAAHGMHCPTAAACMSQMWKVPLQCKAPCKRIRMVLRAQQVQRAALNFACLHCMRPCRPANQPPLPLPTTENASRSDLLCFLCLSLCLLLLLMHSLTPSQPLRFREEEKGTGEPQPSVSAEVERKVDKAAATGAFWGEGREQLWGMRIKYSSCR